MILVFNNCSLFCPCLIFSKAFLKEVNLFPVELDWSSKVGVFQYLWWIVL